MSGRPLYPSDHRRWFRVLEDILDDPKLSDEACPPDVFRLYIRLLAMLNRTKSRDGRITLSRRSVCALAGRERFGNALARLRHAHGAGLVRLSHEDGTTTVEVPKWSELQGFAPAPLRRDSDETPGTTPTPTPTPNERPPAKRGGTGRPPSKRATQGPPPRKCEQEGLDLRAETPLAPEGRGGLDGKATATLARAQARIDERRRKQR